MAAHPLRRLAVEGLFGLYDHAIDFDVDEGLTVLHGPNGVGKSVLLQMLAAIGNRDRRSFPDRPFAALRLWTAAATEPLVFTARPPDLALREPPPFVAHLVDTQRVFTLADHFDGEPYSSSKAVVHDIIGRSQNARQTYAAAADAAKATLYKRQLAAFRDSAPAPSPAALRAQHHQNQEDWAFLRAQGLIQGQPAELDLDQPLDEAQRRFLGVAFADDAAQLALLLPLGRKIALLLRLLNEKLADKTLAIQDTGSLRCTLSTGEPLPLHGLSTGEAHLLVLLHALLFELEPGALLLIDEPELSLHPVWLDAFVPDLLEVLAENPVQVVLATHSPDIAASRRDLLRPLNARRR